MRVVPQFAFENLTGSMNTHLGKKHDRIAFPAGRNHDRTSEYLSRVIRKPQECDVIILMRYNYYKDNDRSAHLQ